ncbi:MAG: cellulase family glycosylhydrolase [Planctomycetota bacterium]
MIKLILITTLLICSCTGTVGAVEAISISKDGKSFVLAESGRPFVAWGFNYDRDYKMRLIEDYWENEWETVVADFRAMKLLGANVVRVHLQYGKFMDAPDKPNTAALDRLEKLVTLAEELGIYLDVTGLACYRMKDQPAWYAQMDEKNRWATQAAFWEAISKRCAGRAGVMAFDLVNEPAVGSNRAAGAWVHETALGGFHYVQFIALDSAGRDGAELWRQWTHTLVTAIRKHDKNRLITVGLLPLPNAGMLKGVGSEVDYMSVHLYPKSGHLDDQIKTLKLYSIGKPLIIEETFPMECTLPEMLEFIEKSKGTANGWISFYWGKPMAELKQSTAIGDHILLNWLEHFQQLAPSIRGERTVSPRTP